MTGTVLGFFLANPVVWYRSLGLRFPHLARLTFAPLPHYRQASKKQRTKASKREQVLRLIAVSSGCLRSLCWLLLHSRREVADGVAVVLTALTANPRTNRWVTSFVEQGCVPVLRMAAGRLSPHPLEETGELADSRITDRKCHALGASPREGLAIGAPHHGHAQRVEIRCASDVGGGDVSDECRVEDVSAAREQTVARVVNIFPVNAASSLLATLGKEASQRHVEGLVRSMRVSGNHELRANVALGLVLLSTGNGDDYGNKVWSA